MPKKTPLYEKLTKPAKKRNVAWNALPINILRKTAGVHPYYKDRKK